MDSKRFDLYVMPLGGSPTALVEDVVMNPGGPQWMPNGGEIVAVINDDDRYDPIYRVPVDDPGSMTQVETGTVGNSDHDIATGTDGRVYLAVTAQGETGGDARDFKRIFVMPLD